MTRVTRTTVALLTAALFLPGCMTFEVGSNGSRPVDAKNKFETVHGSFYGFNWSKYHVQKCNDGPLEHVEFHFNALQLTASVVTLGLYVPQTVEWWCDDSRIIDDEDDPEPDPGGEFSGATPPAMEGANQ